MFWSFTLINCWLHLWFTEPTWNPTATRGDSPSSCSHDSLTTPLLRTFTSTPLILPHPRPHSGLFTSLKGPAATAQTPATSSHPAWSLTSLFSHLRLDLIINVFLFLLTHGSSSVFPSPLFSCDYVATWLQQVPSCSPSILLAFSWLWSSRKSGLSHPSFPQSPSCEYQLHAYGLPSWPSSQYSPRIFVLLSSF